MRLGRLGFSAVRKLSPSREPSILRKPSEELEAEGRLDDGWVGSTRSGTWAREILGRTLDEFAPTVQGADGLRQKVNGDVTVCVEGEVRSSVWKSKDRGRKVVPE